MKSYVNLLPKDEQREVVLERITAKLKNLFAWILLSLLVLAGFLLATRIYLGSELSRVSEQVNMQRQVVSQAENRELKQQLDGLNTHLSNLVLLDEQQAVWSEVLIELARLTPVDTSIDTIQADRESFVIRLTGFSLNRDSVLQFRRNLLASEYFSDVDFPLSNLIKPTDVNFHYSFYVNENSLKGL
jgi:Tfp pilus assembly protein PilN